MEQDENTVATEDQQQDSETVVEETADTTEDNSEVKAEDKVALSPAEYRHFKKWEANGKQTVKPGTRVETQSQSSQPNVEETVLLANGMPEELVNELKVIAKVRGVSLLKAQNDPIFVAVKEKFDKDAKSKEASVGASRGAGSIKARKDFNTPGLSRDEHRKMVADSQ